MALIVSVVGFAFRQNSALLNLGPGLNAPTYEVAKAGSGFSGLWSDGSAYDVDRLLRRFENALPSWSFRLSGFSPPRSGWDFAHHLFRPWKRPPVLLAQLRCSWALEIVIRGIGFSYK